MSLWAKTVDFVYRENDRANFFCPQLTPNSSHMTVWDHKQSTVWDHKMLIDRLWSQTVMWDHKLSTVWDHKMLIDSLRSQKKLPFNFPGSAIDNLWSKIACWEYKWSVENSVFPRVGGVNGFQQSKMSALFLKNLMLCSRLAEPPIPTVAQNHILSSWRFRIFYLLMIGWMHLSQSPSKCS